MTTHAEGAEDPRELTPELAGAADTMVEAGGGLVTMITCGSRRCSEPRSRVQLGVDWQIEVNGTPALRIPIIGCGSPWHYIVGVPPVGMLRGLSDPEPLTASVGELAPPTRRVAISLRWPDAHVSAVGIDWPADVRLPVPGDAFRLPSVGIAVVSGTTFGTATEVDGDGSHELFAIEISATVINGSDR